MDINNGNCMKKLLTLCGNYFICSGNPRWRIQGHHRQRMKADLAAKKSSCSTPTAVKRGPKAIFPARLILPPPKTNWRTVLPRQARPGSRLLRRTQVQGLQAAARAAEKLGYTNIRHLTAGISGWKEAGEKTEPAKKARANVSLFVCRAEAEQMC